MSIHRIAGSILLIVLIGNLIMGPETKEPTYGERLTNEESTAAFTSGLLPETEQNAEKTARELTLKMNCSEQDRIWMTDDNVWTSGYFTSEEPLQIRGEGPIAYLYVIWDTRPAPWTLTAGNMRLDCGTQGFFHELVELPHAEQELTLLLPKQEKTEISGLYAFSEGELPDWVQAWEPPCETADILLFPTHSDDEFIFFGGLLPSYAGEQGLDVQVAYLVDHYEWERQRWHELLDGLWTAGVRHYPVNGGFSDGKFASMDETIRYYDAEQILNWQVETLRRFRPLVVAGHDARRGEDGSWTHALNGQSLREAVVLAGDADYDPESARQYGTWDTPKLYLHLYGDTPTVLDYETPLARFSGKTAFQMAVEAFACHKSQQNYGYIVYGADAPYYDSHVFGLVRSLVGEDEARNDLMEHIQRSDWRDADSGSES